MYIIQMTSIFGIQYYTNERITFDEEYEKILQDEKDRLGLTIKAVNMTMDIKKAHHIKEYDVARNIGNDLHRFWNERKGFATFKIITQGEV